MEAPAPPSSIWTAEMGDDGLLRNEKEGTEMGETREMGEDLEGVWGKNWSEYEKIHFMKFSKN